MSQERARHILKRAGYATGGDVTPREPEPAATARPVQPVKAAVLGDADVKARQPDEVRPAPLDDDDVKPRELSPERRGGRLDARGGRRRK